MSSMKRVATKFDEIMVNKIVKLSDDMEFEEVGWLVVLGLTAL